jgi:hypothetical protein
MNGGYLWYARGSRPILFQLFGDSAIPFRVEKKPPGETVVWAAKGIYTYHAWAIYPATAIQIGY